VTKIPSPGPLAAHHRFMLSNTVVFSSAYHSEELKIFNEWKIDSVLHWPPDLLHTYIHNYLDSVHPKKNTIAFYSHGEWVRRAEGHADPGLGILENESFILQELNLFLSNYNDIRLVIYPHPKERKRADMESYYANLLPNCTYSIYAGEFPTAWNFHQEDLAILAYSTLLFERLALGFKTMFVSLQQNSFPIAESPLNHICLRSKSDFHEKIKEAIGQNKLDYFEKNCLNSYLLSEFLHSKSIQD
jgi:hypothetical protein